MTMINIVERKRHLSKRHVGRAFIYTPVHSEDEAVKEMAREFVGRVFDGSSSSLLQLVRGRSISRVRPKGDHCPTRVHWKIVYRCFCARLRTISGRENRLPFLNGAVLRKGIPIGKYPSLLETPPKPCFLGSSRASTEPPASSKWGCAEHRTAWLTSALRLSPDIATGGCQPSERIA
jgi:Penicillinase repressor